MKTDAITRDQVGWLIVRTAGIYFGWMAFTRLAAFVYAAYLLTSQGWQDIRETIGGRLSWELTWPKAAQFVLYAAMAFYLLRGGRFIHRLLTSTPQRLDTVPKVSELSSEADENKADSVQPTTP